MRWLAILNNGYRYEGPWPLLSRKDTIRAIEVYYRHPLNGDSRYDIIVPEDRRPIVRRRVRRNLTTGEEFAFLFIALEPRDETLRHEDTYGYMIRDGHHVGEFVGYRDADTRAPMLETFDL